MTVVTNFLMIVEVIVSILLIVVVVAQNSKNAGMGGAVSGAADSSFGGKQRGLDAFLSKCTIILGLISLYNHFRYYLCCVELSVRGND